ncbi:MAG: hypothetical protein DRN88_03855 [Candidatus Hydrothermarchaeota archaeon]|nr:MAG: hypothetical protein DRN88_03855 [Candidatus Hydrothermarchaeota archaeon]
MPRGFGRRGGFGRGRGFGVGFRGFRGNPYPFCRFFPWLPRWWWTGIYGPITPYTPYIYPTYPAYYQYPRY